MSKDEFIEDHRHELAGWVLDAVTTQRTGGELGLYVRSMMRKIDARLAKMHDQLVKDEKNQPPKRTA